MKTPNQIQLETAVDRLENELLLRLIRGTFKSGEYLPSHARLASMFGVSLNSMRSAIGRLTAKGLVTQVPGQGFRVEELLHSCDMDMLLRIVSDKTELERALELEAQLLDLMSVVLLEVVARAATCRTADHIKWFNHYLRMLLDRIDLEAHVAFVVDAQFQLLRVVAGAAGSIAFNVLLNSFRPYLQSAAGLDLFPPDAWGRLAKAFEAKDAADARQILQRCFDVRGARVLNLLAKTRGIVVESESPKDVTFELAESPDIRAKNEPH